MLYENNFVKSYYCAMITTLRIKKWSVYLSESNFFVSW